MPVATDLQRITYHDVASYQGAYNPTGPVMAKATEGTRYTNPYFRGVRDRAAARSHPFSAYHWLRHLEPKAQALYALSVVGKSIPLMMDVESAPNLPDPTLADLVEFIDEYRRLGGLVTMAYIPQWFWSGHWKSPSLKPLVDRHIALVSSNYPSNGYTQNGPGWKAYGGMTPLIWQYTSTPLDTNAIKGGLVDLKRIWWFGSGTAPPPPKPPKWAMPAWPGRILTQPPQMSGKDVQTWQHGAILLGQKIAEDGDYGPKSETACKVLQKRFGLVQDGDVGPKTWAATRAAVAKLP